MANVTSTTATPSESEQIEQLKKQLQWAELKICVLEERLRLQLIAKYGPGSEKLNDAQLELLELEPGVSSVEVEKESNREPLPPSAAKTRKPHPGRQELPAELPRVERVIACTPEQCKCRVCGQATVVIGYEKSEYLDIEPARYFVVVSKREKRACNRCDQGGVAAASLPTRIIEKSLVSDRIVIDTIVSKYGDYQPLYRQSAFWNAKRESRSAVRRSMDG
jgi:transposase